ncbi:hypothetical protein, partial [Streptomyces spongiae]|uniref:hypothetical protein n=1 Tax=Streptomyces spongiae TaxID=565072 RepID=UPI001D154F18
MSPGPGAVGELAERLRGLGVEPTARELAPGVDALGGGELRGARGRADGFDDPAPYDDRGVLDEPDL